METKKKSKYKLLFTIIAGCLLLSIPFLVKHYLGTDVINLLIAFAFGFLFEIMFTLFKGMVK